ncbi:DUF2997 domain-containing protein [Prochlorococcus marinus]|uniref:DUF2997 domain-containing protein n=1 Tax=Prochlorococcus marinus TaxID=1219 RepID=UPI0022B54357|nr:DUF2997 domain-containing protein [Prochlorococcus marinus]
MPQRVLRFKIRQDGVVEETVEGIVGQACYQLTEKLESALGNVEQTELTSEAYICPEEQSQFIQEQIKLH